MKKFLVLLPLIVLAGAGCGSSTQVTTPVPGVQNPTPTPTSTGTETAVMITELKPASGKAGSEVTVTGQGFTKTGNHILFGKSYGRHRPDGSADNVTDTVDSADGKSVTFTIPTSGPSGILCSADGHCVGIAAMLLQPGSFDVAVSNANGTSNALTFTVTR